jgi:hypothetical protein
MPEAAAKNTPAPDSKNLKQQASHIPMKKNM